MTKIKKALRNGPYNLFSEIKSNLNRAIESYLKNLKTFFALQEDFDLEKK